MEFLLQGAGILMEATISHEKIEVLSVVKLVIINGKE